MRDRSKPVVLVTGDTRLVDNYTWHCIADQYVRALAGVADVVPLGVPNGVDTADLPPLLARVDGVLSTGSRSNMHPSHYDAPSLEAEAGPYDRARDPVALALLRGAVAARLPLLALCRGHQELNVAMGGTLGPNWQEREGRFDHRSRQDTLDQDLRFALSHEVTLEPDARLREVFGKQRVRVNSLHGQSIDRLADGLVVEATASDGTIEAVRVAEHPGFAFGVQWHPEYWAESDPPSRALFEAFGAACRQRMASGGLREAAE